MKRVYISLSDDTYELLRKQAFDAKVMPGTLAARMVSTHVGYQERLREAAVSGCVVGVE